MHGGRVACGHEVYLDGHDAHNSIGCISSLADTRDMGDKLDLRIRHTILSESIYSDRRWSRFIVRVVNVKSLFRKRKARLALCKHFRGEIGWKARLRNDEQTNDL